MIAFQFDFGERMGARQKGLAGMVESSITVCLMAQTVTYAGVNGAVTRPAP